jgi:hypothetical protein
MKPAKMCRKESYVLAVISLCISGFAYAAAGTRPIGTVSARGNVRVDGYTVSGNGTLFDGTEVQTDQAAATLRLDNGTEIKLAINSSGVVYRDHLLLQRGRSQLKTSSSRFVFEAGGLRLAPSGPNSVGVVSLTPVNRVEVGALAGEFVITDDSGSSVARVSPGAAMSLDPAAEGGEPPKGTFSEVGLVSVESGHYYLTGADGKKYELVNWPAKDLQKLVGDKVQVTGVLEAAPSGVSQVLVISIQLNGSISSNTKKIWIVTAIAGGGAAGVGIAVAESGKSSASR